MLLRRHDAELGTLRRLHRDSLAGKGSVVLIRGTVASGKTELLHAAGRELVAHNTLVISATCSRVESLVPLHCFRQIFNHPALRTESNADVAGMLDQLAEAAPPSAAVSERTERAVCAALLQLAQRQPVVITLDDLHDADDAALRCLLRLSNRLRSARILLVLTAAIRPEAPPPLLAEITRPTHCHRHWLAPLDQDGVKTVLAEHLGPEIAHRLAAAAHELTGGNPLLLRGLIDDYRCAGTPGQLAVGEAFADAVSNCVFRAGSTALRTAQALAVLDAESPALLTQLADLHPAVTAKAVSTLQTSGLIADHQFRHPRAHTAVLATMTRQQRAEMHHQVAVLLHGEGAPASVVGRHLLAARDTGQARLAMLRRVAQEALMEGEPALAQRCLRMMEQASENADEQAAILADRAEIEWQRNPQFALHYVDRLVADVRAGYTTGRRALLPVKYLLWAGWVDEAVALLDEYEGNPAIGLSRGQVAAERSWLSFVFPRHRRDVPASRRSADRSATPVSADVHELAAEALAMAMDRSTGTEVVSRAEQVLQCWRPGDAALAPVLAAVSALLISDEFGKAVFWCDTMVQHATARQTAVWHGLFLAARAVAHMRRGDLVLAERDSAQALAELPAAGWGVAVGLPLGTLLAAATEMGRLDEAQAHLAVPVPEGMLDTSYALGYLQARGQYYLTTGRPESALRDFQACGALLVEWSVDLPVLAPWRTDCARALVELGRHDEARELVLRQLMILGEGTSRTHAISLHMLARTSALAERPVLLRQAIEIFKRCDARLELARALADLGLVLSELGQHQQATATVFWAHEQAERCGAVRLAERLAVADRTGTADDCRSGTELDPLAKLSDAERRVAGLAARGHTNQQISRRLHVTVSTVEQHLTKVYRKLSIRRRTDLGVFIAAGLSESAFS